MLVVDERLHAGIEDRQHPYVLAHQYRNNDAEQHERPTSWRSDPDQNRQRHHGHAFNPLQGREGHAAHGKCVSEGQRRRQELHRRRNETHAEHQPRPKPREQRQRQLRAVVHSVNTIHQTTVIARRGIIPPSVQLMPNLSTCRIETQ